MLVEWVCREADEERRGGGRERRIEDRLVKPGELLGLTLLLLTSGFERKVDYEDYRSAKVCKYSGRELKVVGNECISR